MRRNLNKPGVFLQAILNNKVLLRSRGRAGPAPPVASATSAHKKASRRTDWRASSLGRCSHCQPLASINRTAALFLAPICSADTPSGWKLPKRLRIGLLPVPRKGYSLLASA